jgi:hypothetical protein
VPGPLYPSLPDQSCSPPATIIAFAVERLLSFVTRVPKPDPNPYVVDGLTHRAADRANLMRVGARLWALAGCTGPVDGIYFSAVGRPLGDHR